MQDEKNFPAQEAARKDGARLQKENVHQERQKGTGPPPCKGSQVPVLLIDRTERIVKSSAIKENKDFRRLYHRGKSKAGASLVTYCMKNRRGETRVGITTSKKIGTAVERNRARRVIRAAFSQLEEGVTGWDLVFVARSRTTRVKMQVVLADMEKQLTALGVLSHEEHR